MILHCTILTFWRCIALLLCGPPPYEGAAYCVALCLSVCPSVRPSRYRSVTSRHLANYNDTHVLLGTRWRPHIVRPSRPHRFLLLLYYFLPYLPLVISSPPRDTWSGEAQLLLGGHSSVARPAKRRHWSTSAIRISCSVNHSAQLWA